MVMALPCRQRWCPNTQPCPDHPVVPFKQHQGASMGPHWTRLRAMQLTLFPYCVDCGARATDADHVIPRALGGPDALGNLQSRCGPCHHKRTGRMSGR
jgi:5-methylcytosine-specific restriction protein A